MIEERQELTRELRSRHVQLIALGGTIGVGLFLGSARAIHLAGPGLLLNYAIAGTAVFFIMRALGELLVHRPVAGALAVFAEEYVGPFAGFATAWTYWFMWCVVGMAELTAVGIYVRYWFPNVPQWSPALGMLVLLYSSNLLTVRVFGELEFWFSVVKVTTIVVLIGLGVAILIGGFGALGARASITNLWIPGGFFPFGALGIALTLQSVAFAYSGVEVVAMTAAEAKDPESALPRAINSIAWRILVFYIGALAIIMSLIPWAELDPAVSPFVVVFERSGIAGAAHIVNAVVITAAASACNSGLYSTGRMLYFLGKKGQGPRALAQLSKRHVPSMGISASAAVMLFGVLLNAVVPESVFVWVTSIALVGTLWVWLMVMYAHLRFRRAVAQGRATGVSFRMPGSPYSNWLVIAFLAIVFVMLGLDKQTRVALYAAPVWFVILAGAYRWWRRGNQPRSPLQTDMNSVSDERKFTPPKPP